jgi:hypothetical protein
MVIKLLPVQKYGSFLSILWSTHFARVNSSLSSVQYFFLDMIQIQILASNHVRMLVRECMTVASTLLVVQTFSGHKNFNVTSFQMMQNATVSFR